MTFFFRRFIFIICFFNFVFSVRTEPVEVCERPVVSFEPSSAEASEAKRTFTTEQSRSIRTNGLEQNTHHKESKKSPMPVRVLLSSCNENSHQLWQFQSEKGFFVHSVGCKKEKNIFFKNKITIRAKKGYFLCNGKKVDHAIRVTPHSGHGTFDAIAYDGDFFIIPHKNELLCVNQVDLEDYIVAVLRTESWPGWPLEVNKVFAIACRSYVAFKIQEAQRTNRLFHVKNTNAHQTYKGRHDVQDLRHAVEQTGGIVLGFDKKPILAMFDCCCGGVVPAHIADFDFNKAPYLARDYACFHCKQSSLYSWNIAYEHKAFEQVIKQYKKELHRLHGISITKKDKAGLVMEVKLKGHKEHHSISGKQLYSLLKEVKSFHFDVQIKSGKIVFSGRGFGHHIGLCQWGARQMVRDGWGFKSILQFYYPQTQFMKLV